jgi:phospholipase/carboxylesterase
MSPIVFIAAAAAVAALARPRRKSKGSVPPGSSGTASPSKNNSGAEAPSTQALPPECLGLTAEGGQLAGVDYIEFVTGGAGENDELPMVISLHGLGYDNTAHIKWLEEFAIPVRIILPNGFFEKTGRTKRAWWPSYSDRALKEASQGLANFVYFIQQCRPTRGKPVMTGHSMGGYVALDFATQFPELIAATVPVAATRSKRLWDEHPGVPVHGIHGELDNSFESANRYYYEMYERGLPVAMTSVPGAPHRITSKVAGPWRDALSSFIV